MGNRRSAGVVDLYRVEIAGITGCAESLVLSCQLDHAQNVVDNIRRSGHNANVLAGPVTDAPRYSLPTSKAEQRSY